MPGTPGSALGAFIREQRQLAQLSLREMARLTRISNAYLSQVERGLHEPSLRVLQAVSDALGIPVEELVGRASAQDAGSGFRRAPFAAGDADAESSPSAVERAIRQERRLSTSQKEALIAVFHGLLEDSAGRVHPGE